MDGSNPQLEQTQDSKVKCPVCENDFELDLSTLEVGDIVECPICGGTSELVDKEQGTLEPVIKGK